MFDNLFDWMAIFYDSFPLNMQRYQPSTCCVYINPKFLMVLNRSFDGHSKSRVNRPSNGLEPPSFNLSNHFFFWFPMGFPQPTWKKIGWNDLNHSNTPDFSQQQDVFMGISTTSILGFPSLSPKIFTVSKPGFQAFSTKVVVGSSPIQSWNNEWWLKPTCLLGKKQLVFHGVEELKLNVK
jgi:hypothetical protein